MNIKELKKDDLLIQVEMNFGKEDYADKKKKMLNKFRREADIKGFRKGMAPMTLVEKMHGHSALVDAVNELISENLNKYIQDNKLAIIGEPLPNEEKESKNDWIGGENFEFVFDIALAPKVDVKLSSEDKITYNEVTTTEKDKAQYKSNILKQYAKLEDCDAVKDEDFMVADFIQGETKIEKVYVSMKTVKDEDKAMFLGKKVGDAMEIDVVKLFPNEADRAAMLKVKKEELDNYAPVWQFIIKEVKNYVDAVPGEELYTMLFGKDVVKTEEEFNAKLEERMNQEYKQESDYRFMLDTREYLLKKADIKIAEDFMKRYLFTANEGKFKMEEIEKEFPLFLKDFCWQTISQQIVKDQKLEIKKEDLEAQARKMAAYQFAMYGINNVPEEHLNKYAENILNSEKDARRVYEKVEEDLVLNYVRGVVTIEKKKISIDKLRKMNEEK